MKIAHFGAWGSNWGDQAIKVGTHTLFEEVYGEIEWREINCQTTPLNVPLAEELNTWADLVLVGGGGLIWDRPGMNSPSGWQFQYTQEALDALRAPLALYALGYTKFEFGDSTANVNTGFPAKFEAAVDKSVGVSFRNWWSYYRTKEALDYSMEHPLVPGWDMLPCPAMKIADIKPPKDPTALMSHYYEGIELPGPYVGVVPAFDQPHMRWGEPWPLMAEKSISLLLKNIRLWHNITGGSAIIIEHLGKDRHVDWLERALGIDNYYGVIGIDDDLGEPCDCPGELAALLSVYAQCDEVWTMRKHGTLLATAVGTRTAWIPDGAVPEVAANRTEWGRSWNGDWTETLEWIGSLL